MKISLTIEQSAELIRLGVSEKKASVKTSVDDPSAPDGVRLAVRFVIADLISMMPKSFRLGDFDFGFVHELDISWYAMYGYWRVTYNGSMDCRAPELIDALYGSLIQLIKCKQLKPEEL